MKNLLLAALMAAFTPATALACGGLFCDTNQPVNQAAERILFAQDGDTIQMHVRLSWSGPPSDFGWLLPVPADVETALSSEAIFPSLDQAYGPQFRMTTEFVNCENDDRAFGAADGGASFGAGGAGGGGGEGPGGVNVLSREQVGPYDRAILQADSVGDLLQWLDENGYQTPEGAEATLQPYIDLGAAFVAIKLVPGAGSQEVAPLMLTFTASGPAIPMRPTANAADPDMGVIVHVLGQSRAVPTNFRHVQINQAAIDWPGAGQNYADVVSQAADEANGQAFATDYAGPVTNTVPQRVADDALAALEDGDWATVRDWLNINDPDVQRAVRATVTPIGDVSLEELISCPWCFDDDAADVDAAGLVTRLRDEVNAPRLVLEGLFEANPYITRLYTTLSPAEMTADPMFDTNPDMGDAQNIHNAVQMVPCIDGETRFDLAVIETEDGLSFAVNPDGSNPDAIQRQDGATVRGQGVPAAAVIEQTLVAGQPQIIEDRRGALARRYDAAKPVDEGCGGCAQSGGEPIWLGTLALLGIMVRRRRR